METVRQCKKCGETKTIEQFPKLQENIRRRTCNACHAEYVRAWEKKHKQQGNADRNVRRRAEAKEKELARLDYLIKQADTYVAMRAAERRAARAKFKVRL